MIDLHILQKINPIRLKLIQMDNNDLQNRLFQDVKAKLQVHVSLVDEVADVLGISNDSAYRRIRCEKQITLNELKLLCTHFNFSLDQLLGVDSKSYIFTGNLADNSNFDFGKYLTELLQILKHIESLPGKQIYFDAKDVPIFHYFQFPYLAAFKYFFWQRVVLEDFREGKRMFEPDEFLGSINDTGKMVCEVYTRIPSNEIWSPETINSTFKQIEFCYATRMFKSNESMFKVYEELQLLIDHLEHQAEIGEKYLVGTKPTGNPNNLKFYVNEVLLGLNTVLIDSEKHRFVSVNHNFFNFMITHDKGFFEYTFKTLNKMIRKSKLISIVNEKERSIFFNSIKKEITERVLSLR